MEGGAMSVNPDSIPRYVEPTPAELDEMFHDPTPEECYRDCTHRDACRRLYEMFVYNTEHADWFKDMVNRLDCGECEEWE